MTRARVLLLALTALSASPAWAESLLYARGGVGVTNGDKLSAFGANPADLFRGQTGTSVLYEAGLGTGIPFPFPLLGLRGELAATYRPDFKFSGSGTIGGKPAASTIGVDNYTGMANLYLDGPNLLLLRPYLGAGAGVARNHVAGTDTDFAWNIMAGFSFQLLPLTSIDLTLRHLDAGSVTGGLQLGANPAATLNLHSQIKTNEGVLGIRFGF